MKMTLQQKRDFFIETFEESVAVEPHGDPNKSESLIILDGIENILEYINQNRFNDNLFHLIKTLMGETKHHVLLTTSYYDELNCITFMDNIDKKF